MSTFLAVRGLVLGNEEYSLYSITEEVSFFSMVFFLFFLFVSSKGVGLFLFIFFLKQYGLKNIY